MSDARVSVHQQGVPDVRRLLRQRTRWAQGNLQAMSHLRGAWGISRSLPARLDLVAYLLQPVFQAVIGVAFAVSIVLAVSGRAEFWGENGWLQLAFFSLCSWASAASFSAASPGAPATARSASCGELQWCRSTRRTRG